MNEVIQGTLANIFRQFDSGYLIATIDPGGRKVVGTLPDPVIGDKLEFHGRWEEHPQYGKQFRFDLAVTVTPRTQQEMLEFLSQLKHIGPARALIMGCYQNTTIEMVKENPYRMIRDIQGFGFKTIDSFAMQMGIEGDSPFRAEAVVEHILNSYAESKKHTYLPDHKIFEKGAGELGIPCHRLEDALVKLEEHKTILRHSEDKWCALKYFHDRERNITERLRQLMRPAIDSATESEISDTFTDPITGQTITLNDRQLEAVRIACCNNVSVITGLPGTGKTTLLKTILNIYNDERVRLASPTGKAAKRMEEATGLPACTVHRLLEYDPITEGFIRGTEVPLDADLVVIDEMSMMDVWLMDYLLKAIVPETKLIFCG